MHTSRLLTRRSSCQVGWSPVPDARFSMPTLTGEDAQVALEKQKEPDPSLWRADEKPRGDWGKSLFGQPDACWVKLHMPTVNGLDSLCRYIRDLSLSDFTQIYESGLFFHGTTASWICHWPWVAIHLFQLEMWSIVHPKLHVNSEKQDFSVLPLLLPFTYLTLSLQSRTWQRCVCTNPRTAPRNWFLGKAGKAFLLVDLLSLFCWFPQYSGQ